MEEQEYRTCVEETDLAITNKRFLETLQQGLSNFFSYGTPNLIIVAHGVLSQKVSEHKFVKNIYCENPVLQR